MSLMLTAFICAVIAAAILVWAYGAYADEHESHLSRMPKTVRILIYPVILLCFVYVYALFFAISVWGIPNIMEWLLSIIVAIIASVNEMPWLNTTLEIISEIVGCAVLIKGFLFPFILINFGPEKVYTFFYRLAILIPVTTLLLCMIIIKPMSGHEWYDVAIFSTAIVIGALVTFQMMIHDMK